MAATASRDAKREGGVVTTVAGHAAHWPTDDDDDDDDVYYYWKFATVSWTSERLDQD